MARKKRGSATAQRKVVALSTRPLTTAAMDQIITERLRSGAWWVIMGLNPGMVRLLELIEATPRVGVPRSVGHGPPGSIRPPALRLVTVANQSAVQGRETSPGTPLLSG